MQKKQRVAEIFVISIFSIFIFASCTLLPKNQQEFGLTVSQDEKELHKVVRIVDGDTIVLEINGKDEKIRLIGINTPETVDPRREVECFGREASNKAKELLENKSVRLELDPTQSDQDKYGRLLRFVFLEDGTNVNEVLVKEGFAYEYTYDNPYKYQKEFKNAQIEAKREKRGLWADDACIDEAQEESKLVPEERSKLSPEQSPGTDEIRDSGCDPNYSGCVPIATDVDCAGGSGNGPAYLQGSVHVIGKDIYGLDPDKDGVACD